MPLSETESANLGAVRALYAAIADGPSFEPFERLCAPTLRQEEFPNRLLPDGAKRDLAGLREAMGRGRALMARQSFELLTATAMEDRVLVEGRWSGTVAADLGPFKAGTVLRTHFAQALTFHGGQIISIRNYDCFEPW